MKVFPVDGSSKIERKNNERFLPFNLSKAGKDVWNYENGVKEIMSCSSVFFVARD